MSYLNRVPNLARSRDEPLLASDQALYQFHDARNNNEGFANGSVRSTNSGHPNIDQSPYKRLDLTHPEREFRLLLLYPGPKRARIRCRLLHKYLRGDHPQRFKALSYAWEKSQRSEVQASSAKSTKSFHIEVDEFQVSVQLNLYRALKHLRHASGIKLLWVDALCIDQSDVREKNHQVDLMKEIYERAEQVVVWLGPVDVFSRHIITLADRIFKESSPDLRRQIIFRALNSGEPDFCRSYKAFFERSYWYRTWVIQEIFSASSIELRCGNLAINWDALVLFQDYVLEMATDFTKKSHQEQFHSWHGMNGRQKKFNGWKLQNAIKTADRFVSIAGLRNSVDHLEASGQSLCSLEELLFSHWKAIATDPRDKIFAMFRMASDGNRYDIAVDYDVDVSRLYTSVVKQAIENSGSLSIILPQRTKDAGLRLPSWVPDWSSTKPSSRKGNHADVNPFPVSPARPTSREYCAAGSTRADVRYCHRNLLARGLRLGIVRSNHNNRDEPVTITEKKSWLDHLFESLGLCFGFGHASSQRSWKEKASRAEQWYMIFRQALCKNFSFRMHRKNMSWGDWDRPFKTYCRRQHEKFFWALHRATQLHAHEKPRENWTGDTKRWFWKWRGNGDIPHAFRETFSKEMTPELREICEDMGRIQINEKYINFFVTKEGDIGLGPMELVDRDSICVLYGCDFPVVLRWNRLNRRYKLLGSCYVVGAMHGEALKRGITDQDFEIC